MNIFLIIGTQILKTSSGDVIIITYKKQNNFE